MSNATAETTPRGGSSSPVQIAAGSLDDLRAQLGGEGRSLYAVLDPTNDARVLDRAEMLGPRADCLYDGESAVQLRKVAPYLARVTERLLGWIDKTLMAGSSEDPSVVRTDPWGILLSTEAEHAALRKHLRRFLWVEGPDGEELYFRFYDPRVLPVFLEHLTNAEAKDFFGPIGAFYVQTRDGDIAKITLHGV